MAKNLEACNAGAREHDDWQPTDVLHPGTCPPHLSQAMRAAIAEGLAVEEDRLKLIRQRTEETK